MYRKDSIFHFIIHIDFLLTISHLLNTFLVLQTEEEKIQTFTLCEF